MRKDLSLRGFQVFGPRFINRIFALTLFISEKAGYSLLPMIHESFFVSFYQEFLFVYSFSAENGVGTKVNPLAESEGFDQKRKLTEPAEPY